MKYEVKSMYDLQEDYRAYMRDPGVHGLDLGVWLPSLRQMLKPLQPGEFCVVLADTGVGKTAVLQNIALAARERDILLFELELPGTLCFERFTAISNDMPQWKVEKSYRNDGQLNIGQADHIYTCEDSSLGVEEMQEVILLERQERKLDFEVVMVDYVGLMSAKGGSRYERMSKAAEDLKRMAKATKTVVLACAQIHRKGDDAAETVSLHDAKDSGSIENSAGIILGAWRPVRGDMIVKILKSTKGSAGHYITCDFEGSTLKITERDKSWEDLDAIIPPEYYDY